jgi:hypothetical protein
MNSEMSTGSGAEMVDASLTEDAGNEVEQRLAQIAAAMKAKQAGGMDTVKASLPEGTACPIDPAERALCEGCQ